VGIRRQITVGVVLVGVALALACAAAKAEQSSENANGVLNRVLLKASQVAPGYRLKTRADSYCVQACVTLDLCGFTFRSEALRTGRIQVNYTKSSKNLVLSNEVVSYVPGGIAQAFAELNRAVATCPTGPVSSTVQGLGPITYRIKRLSTSTLLPGSIALRLSTSGRARGRHFRALSTAIYQHRGNVLSAVYISSTAISTAAAQWAIAFHAAQGSAHNLTLAIHG
jgi:hypothetical protein